MTTHARGHTSRSSCAESALPSGAKDHVMSCDSELVSARGGANESCDNVTSCDNDIVSLARVAILFSGGIDSAVIAALADR